MMSPARPANKKLEKKSDVQLIWILSLFVVLTAAMLASPVAKLTTYLYPAMTFVVAAYTYTRSKSAYAALVCWLWIMTPFVRRVIDWRVGGSSANLILAAPMLACYATLPFLFSEWKRVVSRAAPVLIALAASCYGVGTGLLNHNHLGPLAIGFAFWTAPICFGLFVCHHQAEAVDVFVAVRNAFVLALLVMSVYGIVQYFYLPAWDRLWIENANLVSLGTAAPQSFRVFGTLNSPQALGSFVLVGLLFTFQAANKLKFISLPLGLVTLVLTGARSAWLGFILGLIYLFFHLPNRQRLQITASAVLAFVVLLVAFQSDSKQAVFGRLQSVTDSHDDSLVTRYKGYEVLLPKFVYEPYGAGLGFDVDEESAGSEGLGASDSGVIALLLSFGVLGTIIYVAGFAMLLRGSSVGPTDERTVLKACVIALASEVVLTDVLQGQSGFLFWAAAALCFQSGKVVFGTQKAAKKAGRLFKAPASLTAKVGEGARALPSN